MQQETKIQLSQVEQTLLMNADWILTKNGIMEKMKLLLQECLHVQEEVLCSYKKNLPAEIFTVNAKISRGENYRGLPWLMLDYPRYFEKENQPGRQAGFFAIRTFFWWGNFFSITLHLSGIYKKMYEQKVIESFDILAKNGFFLCVNNSEWEHYFEADNYKPTGAANGSEFDSIIKEKEFIRLAVKADLAKWNELPRLSAVVYKTLLEILV